MSWNGIIKPFTSCVDMKANWADGHYVVGHSQVYKLEEVLSEMLLLPLVITNRGMTAIMTVIMVLTKAGDTIVCSEAVYPGTRLRLEELEAQGRIKVIWWDPTDHDELRRYFELSSQPGDMSNVSAPRLIFCETIGNAPSMPIADLEVLSGFAQMWDVPLVVDTTFTPFWTPKRPINHLIVVGSMTKYHTNGDNTMGGYIAARLKMLKRITSTRFYMDSVMLPDVVSNYLSRGQLDTMGDRYRDHCRNALDAAKLMSDHQAVGEVCYPGLDGHPNRQLLEQFNWMAGAVFYCRLAGGEKAAIKLADALVGQGDWELAVSFGSAKWRVFPFIGELAQHVGVEGIVRISTGYPRGKDSEFAAPNLGILRSVLDTLVN
ncbi:PLP-dependent transferase [bacterium]|nr:PLP-dependent transferase [bacterium]